ncbi:bifunctional riboflavin kinase/FMN adenylyltransferase [Spiroplasma corruscae]|uniref:FAD synthase n=1 Tax=Spiroplasma corruscae TaxID=216934 RepID=A0A222ENN8_9MOLU|nr:hypothetical protein [Spiroplasma corruscae]ASP28107.1 bifunctional riboflavin kinase/FMN adenylyltransferase [Spiroplasma corruscae]
MIKIVTNLNNDEVINLNNNFVACIGFFDGLHKVHWKLFMKAKRIAKKNNLGFLILTFSNKITNFITGKDYVLYNNKIRYKLFKEKCNPDLLVEINVNKKTISKSKEDFCNFLINKLNVKKVVIGEDFRFGNNKSGNVNDLIYFLGMGNVKIFKREEKISTSNAKMLLQDGNIRKVNKLLKYKYLIIIKKNINNEFSIISTNIVLKDGYYKLLINNKKYVAKITNNLIIFKETDLAVFFSFFKYNLL